MYYLFENANSILNVMKNSVTTYILYQIGSMKLLL